MDTRKLPPVLRFWTSIAIFAAAGSLSSHAWAQQTQQLRPVQRIPRDRFGVVGALPLTANDLDAMVFPDANADERQAFLDGLKFFSTPHTAAEGAGIDSNQPFCQGCHRNAEELPRDTQLVTTSSPISRAGRSTPTNFRFTSLNPMSGPCPGPACKGGLAADRDETIDFRTGAIFGTGRTAAFTIFGDFRPASDPTALLFDQLDKTGPHFTQPHFMRLSTTDGQNFGGVVQHTRPSISFDPMTGMGCLPDRIPTIDQDTNLPGVTVDPGTGVVSPSTGISPTTGFRRSVGERAAPPYVGRGLMEAITGEDIEALENQDAIGHTSSLDDPTAFPECASDCITGHANHNSSEPTNAGVTGGDLPPAPNGGNDVRVSRFGLRAAGPTLVQFIIGGMQGEVGFTSPLRATEVIQADINIGRMGCMDPVPDPELGLSTVVNTRTLIRMVPPPEFGETLLGLLKSPDPMTQLPGRSPAARVQRGAILFGIDVVAFANRTIPGRMPQGGDGREPHAINRVNRWLNCAGCHVPIHKTGQSPAGESPSDNVARHLSFVWAPIFSDLLLHKMTAIDAERQAPAPRTPFLIVRSPGMARGREADDDDDDGDGHGHGRGLGVGRDKDDHGHGNGHGKRDDDEDGDGRPFATFDVPRNLADDTLPTQGMARGDLWRTPPLMGLGRVGPPFLHDARVYLSVRTANTTPAGTVMSNSEVTNAPLVVQTLDDALRAVIELHDLPPPDDAKTPNVPGAGCPVPPPGTSINVAYGASPRDVICPSYASDTSRANRSEAKEVIRRYRALSPEDQQALIDFLKEL